MFICGTGSFGNQDEADNEAYVSPCSTPKRSKSKNPYSNRGLDKFNSLLADLNDKKQKIYTQKGSEDIRFVRFVYTNDSDIVKPIVVKAKEKNPSKNLIQHPSFKAASPQADPDDGGEGIPPEGESTTVEESKKCENMMMKKRGRFKNDDLRFPNFYFMVIVVFILLFLAVYGRSFAILCTSIVWYLAPTIAGGSSPAVSSERKAKRKKKEEEVISEAPSSPKSVIDGLNQVQEQPHDRKRCW